MTDPVLYNMDLEDTALLDALPQMPLSFAEFSRPAEVDVDWHRHENQGRMGSCQGNDLSSILERHAHVRGEKIQLSGIFAYLATQKIDGLLGRDSGSTISGGIKLAMSAGVPPESMTGYPSSYPSRQQIRDILSQENYKAGEPYKATSSWKVPRDNVDESLNFIGGGGGISIGIAWWSGVIPRDRVVRNYRPPSGRLGGHAMAVLGYKSTGELVAVNSHADGPYLWTPEAWLQMLRHNRTAAVGLVGTADSQPVDWVNNSPYFA